MYTHYVSYIFSSSYLVMPDAQFVENADRQINRSCIRKWFFMLSEMKIALFLEMSPHYSVSIWEAFSSVQCFLEANCGNGNSDC